MIQNFILVLSYLGYFIRKNELRALCSNCLGRIDTAIGTDVLVRGEPNKLNSDCPMLHRNGFKKGLVHFRGHCTLKTHLRIFVTDDTVCHGTNKEGVRPYVMATGIFC